MTRPQSSLFGYGESHAGGQNAGRVTEGTARGDGKKEKERETLPLFLLPITPRAPLESASLVYINNSWFSHDVTKIQN